MSLGEGRAQGSVHMFLICLWWEEEAEGGHAGWCCWKQAQEGRELVAAAATGKVQFQGGVEGESARKKGWDLGTGAVSWGRREQVVTCLSAQLFCIQVPERDRRSWEEKKQPGRGISWSFCLSIGSETKAKPPETYGGIVSLHPS